jgi:hypothetical protein
MLGGPEKIFLPVPEPVLGGPDNCRLKFMFWFSCSKIGSMSYFR